MMKKQLEVINPQVTIWVGENMPAKNDVLTETNLYTVLNDCARMSNNAAKLRLMFPFVAKTFGAKKHSNGVLFIKLDHCDVLAKTFYEAFDKLCEAMPNILAAQYNNDCVRFFVYEACLKYNLEDYSTYHIKNTCLLLAAINKVCNIDIKELSNCLSQYSTKLTQGFNLYACDYKFNSNCAAHSQETQMIENEYYRILRPNYLQPLAGLVPQYLIDLQTTGNILVGENFTINTSKGFVKDYHARAAIAAATYYHFNKDLELAARHLYKTYINADIICSQMWSMSKTNSIANKYDKVVEDTLFA